MNVIVAGKQPQAQWLTMDEAIIHCTRGAGIWEWASNDAPGAPDVVMACCGDTPTLETLAAVSLLRTHLPSLKVRVVNVVDLMRLEPESEHPHGMSDPEFDALFTVDRPVIFAYHGYPSLIHRLTYRRQGHDNFHVRGIRRKAPPPRRSTWSCSTTWTGSTWSWTSSTGCRGWPLPPGTFGS